MLSLNNTILIFYTTPPPSSSPAQARPNREGAMRSKKTSCLSSVGGFPLPRDLMSYLTHFFVYCTLSVISQKALLD
jgi:hypothetical protein